MNNTSEPKEPLSAAAAPADEKAQEKRNLDRIIHSLLVWGVWLSSTVMLFGLGVAAVTGKPVPGSVPPFQQLIPQALALQPGAILALGLLILIATPILRVVSSVFAFIYERDWRYALITFIVFLIVMTSIYLGRG